MQITLLLPQTLVMWEVTDATGSSGLLNYLVTGTCLEIVNRATVNLS